MIVIRLLICKFNLKKYSSTNYHLPFDDSFSSTTSADAMTFKDRQKRFNRFVKKRFIDEFGPIEYLSYKMLKRHESSMMDRIKRKSSKKKFLVNFSLRLKSTNIYF